MKKVGRFVKCTGDRFFFFFFFYNNRKQNISEFCFIFRCEIVKTKRARDALQIVSFSWSILSSTIALNQSARENPNSYCK